MKLTATDLEILRTLQADCYRSNEAIGETVNKSGSAVSRRIGELQKAKVITGLHAAIDPDKIGLKTTVFTLVSLKQHGDGTTANFAAVIDTWPNVIECARTSGSWDFLLKFLVRDTRHHDELHNKLLAMPEVSRVRGMHVIGSPKTKPVPI